MPTFFSTCIRDAEGGMFNKPALCWQEPLLQRLRIGDLVDQNPNTTLGNDVGCAVANLDSDDGMCRVDAEHGKQVHDRVCAPTDDSHDLGCLDLPLNDWISFTVCGSAETDE